VTVTKKRAVLVDEEEYLRKSLEDLDRERAVGDLDPADYEQLRQRYLARAEEIAAALAGLGNAPADAAVETEAADRTSSSPVRRWLSDRRHRLVLGWSAAVCFALAGTLVGLGAAGVPPFGRAPNPTLDLAAQIQTELAEASVLAANHNVVQAIGVYGKVLQLDPTQPEALADGGWLIRLAGLSSKDTSLVGDGDREIAAAVRISPGYALARAYDGVALFQDAHSASASVTQFAAMLADHASATLVTSVRGTAVKAYAAAGVAVPPALAVTPG